MKSVLIGTVFLLLSVPAFATAGANTKVNLHLAEAANNCLRDCETQNDSCKRLCPTTYSGPCISACDKQVQFCRQACQRE
jgi:hypothetical protein